MDVFKKVNCFLNIRIGLLMDYLNKCVLGSEGCFLI